MIVKSCFIVDHWDASKRRVIQVWRNNAAVVFLFLSRQYCGMIARCVLLNASKRNLIHGDKSFVAVVNYVLRTLQSIFQHTVSHGHVCHSVFVHV